MIKKCPHCGQTQPALRAHIIAKAKDEAYKAALLDGHQTPHLDFVKRHCQIVTEEEQKKIKIDI